MPNMPRMRLSPSSSHVSMPGIQVSSPKLPIFAHTSSAGPVDRDLCACLTHRSCRLLGVSATRRDTVVGHEGSSRNEVPVPSPAELFDLTGKVAVVTGGSRGIGRAVCFALAAAGADVVVASRKLDNCESAAGRDREDHRPPRAPDGFNVRHWDHATTLVDAVYERVRALRGAGQQRRPRRRSTPTSPRSPRSSTTRPTR